MTKEVLIHMKGLQMMENMEDQGEPVELITVGEYYFRNKNHYLLYEEVMEEGSDPVKNIVKIRPGTMEVRKKGIVDVHMIFEENKKNLAYYKTPFGTIEMEIAATKVAVEEKEDEINIRTDYALGMNGMSVADCSMKIRAIPKGDKKGAVFFE